MPKKLNLAGQTIGRLTVVSPTTKRDSTGRVIWKCSCSCGADTYVCASNLKYKRVLSCGCLQKEITNRRCTKHGDYGTPIYIRWWAMKSRCNSRPYYTDVSICKEWSGDNGYLNFKDWVFSRGYNNKNIKDLHIHRINDAKVYSPTTCEFMDRHEHAQLHSNCRWAKDN